MNYFLFDVDPENAELEAEKDACMVENKKRREEKQADKSDSEEEEHDTHDVIDLEELPPQEYLD